MLHSSISVSSSSTSGAHTPTATVRPRRSLGLAGSVAAGVAALVLAFGVPAASAATYHVSQGHADIARASINPTANKLILGLNHEYTGAYYTAAQVAASPTKEPVVDVVVTQREGSSWVIKANDSNPSQLLAGFALSGSEAPEGIGAEGVLVNGDRIAYSVVPASGNPGSVSVVFDSTQNVVSSGTTHTARVADVTAPEALHVHPKWTFSAAGTYYVTIKASNVEGKVAASDPLTYKIVTK
ncbi:TIGR03769 domain-containing protein [Arthrobacter sp.]|uniref:TIGR03769 domain-containing protein n=1 Tax=Arthrobacter sp. TaxID=1667 RepID=UPI002812524C|nr:TIGR03769 domain-containing protein [Arthrobacter sp.]